MQQTFTHQSSFEGIWVPIITPFRDGRVDHATLARLARDLSTQGIAGLVVGATTGEGALLDPGEQEAMIATLREAVPRVRLVPGIAEADTRRALLRARQIAALKPDALLVTAPLYVRPTQAGIRAHFEAIAAADVPLLIYNIPYRTGVGIEIDTLRMLAADARIVGIKECGGSAERTLSLVHETPLYVLCGDDAQIFSALCAGAHGAIAASAHLRPDLHVRLWRCIQAGRLAEARRIAVALQGIVSDLFAEPNPAPVKALLATQGYGDGSLRTPFLAPSPVLTGRLKAHLAALPA